MREVDANGVSFHRVLALNTGNYNIGTLAVELQRQLRLGTRIDDGEWTVTSDQEGRLTLRQSSPTASAKLYSQSDVRGRTPVDINWLFATTTARETTWQRRRAGRKRGVQSTFRRPCLTMATRAQSSVYHTADWNFRHRSRPRPPITSISPGTECYIYAVSSCRSVACRRTDALTSFRRSFVLGVRLVR